jgi:hypothetical protein
VCHWLAIIQRESIPLLQIADCGTKAPLRHVRTVEPHEQLRRTFRKSFCVCFGSFDCWVLGIKPSLSRTSVAAAASHVQGEAMLSATQLRDAGAL